MNFVEFLYMDEHNTLHIVGNPTRRMSVETKDGGEKTHKIPDVPQSSLVDPSSPKLIEPAADAATFVLGG